MKIRNRKLLLLRFHSTNRQIQVLITGLILIFMLFPDPVEAQDTTKFDKVKSFFSNQQHSPTKAMIYSAIIPGWGQAYNRKYWKIPIVYAGIGVAGYFIKTNHDQYILHKNDYLLLVDDPNASTVSGLSKEKIRIRIDQFRRYRDLSFIGLIAWYGLGLIDANVDGYFFNYDINEDLSLLLQPRIFETGGMDQGVGISLNFRWR